MASAESSKLRSSRTDVSDTGFHGECLEERSHIRQNVGDVVKIPHGYGGHGISLRLLQMLHPGGRDVDKHPTAVDAMLCQVVAGDAVEFIQPRLLVLVPDEFA